MNVILLLDTPSISGPLRRIKNILEVEGIEVTEIFVNKGVESSRNLLTSFQYFIESSRSSIVSKRQYINIDELPERIVLNLSNLAITVLSKEYHDFWCFEYHGHNLACYSNGVGFLEIGYNADTVNVEIVRYIEGKRIMYDVAKYNLHYSAFRVLEKVVTSLVPLLIKIIRNNTVPRNEVGLFNNQSKEGINLRYLLHFYAVLLRKYYNVFINRFLGLYAEHWSLGFSKSSFLTDKLNSLVVLNKPKSEFWADPFAFSLYNRNYIFFERFPFKEKKGVISVGEIIDDKIENIKDIIVKPYHLSYPDVFEEDGEIYMIPECCANNRVEIYKCKCFPYEWELFATGFDGFSLVDICYYRDDNGDRWLMASRSYSGVVCHNEVLELYQIDSLQLNSFKQHKANPIYVDSTKGRNGGRIYKENNHLYRVSQDNRHGTYGYGIRVFEIDKITIDEYEEHEVCSLKGSDLQPFIGTHQMSQTDGFYSVDLRER